MSQYTTAAGILVEQILKKLSGQTDQEQREASEIIARAFFPGLDLGQATKIIEPQKELERKSIER